MQTWQQWLAAQGIDSRWHPKTRLQDEYRPTVNDRRAAFSLYTELRTRITLQPLHPLSGDEATALKSVFALFGTARMTMQSEGPTAMFFADLATAMLNGPIRPFTARWHGVSEAGQLRPGDSAIEFRRQLRLLQEELRPFAQAFRAMADEHAGPPPFPHEQPSRGTATSAPIKDPELPGLPEGLDAEDSHVLTRRETIDTPAPPTLAGLALSGGGVRSATFCLGVIRVLARHRLLREFDYLSTVSGGGYLGAFVSTLPAHGSDLETELENPEVLSNLRRRSIHHLLGANPIVNVLQALVGYLGGLLLNLAPALAILAALLLLREGVANTPPHWLAGTLAGLGLLFVATPPRFAMLRRCAAALAMAAAAVGAHHHLPGWSWPWATAIVGATCAFAALWRIRAVRHQIRDAAIGLTVLTAVAAGHDLAGEVVTALRDPGPTLGWIGLAVFGLAAVSILFGQRGLARWLGLLFAATVVPLAAITMFFSCDASSLASVAARLPWLGEYFAQQAELSTLALLMVSTVLLLSGALMVLGNVNYNAPHRFYRARLAEAYVALNPRGPAPKLSKLPDLARPLHLIQATINLPGSNTPAQRGRGCGAFTFGPFQCGTDRDRIATDQLELLDPHLDLATAVAISGAAASSLMGVVAPRSTVPLLTFLNIRLGYWVQRARDPDADPPKSCGRPNLFYLLREALQMVDEKTPCWNVSDGGHFENLGVYQLLQRHCGFVVVVDAEADFARTCDAMVRLIHLARVDLNCEIRINLGDLSPDANSHSRRHAAFGTIDYQDGSRGYLLYFKASLTGDEDPTIRTYHRRHPSFPHESTANQHFSEDQFEAYRVLGEHVAERILKDVFEDQENHRSRLEHLWTKLRQTMLPDA